MNVENISNQSRFGRLPHPDHRDLKFSLARRVSAAAARQVVSKMWPVNLTLDQGDTPQCVEYSSRTWLSLGPVSNRWRKPDGWLYHEAQKIDEWDGEDYDGTSVRAGFKVLQSQGYLSSYGWAFDNATVTAWLLTQGPLVVGTDWFADMMLPDAQGFLHVAGGAVGGHAYSLRGTDTRKVCPDGSLGAHRVLNNWGKGWADKGQAWLSYRDFQTLLDRWGEACTALEIRRV